MEDNTSKQGTIDLSRVSQLRFACGAAQCDFWTECRHLNVTGTHLQFVCCSLSALLLLQLVALSHLHVRWTVRFTTHVRNHSTYNTHCAILITQYAIHHTQYAPCRPSTSRYRRKTPWRRTAWWRLWWDSPCFNAKLRLRWGLKFGVDSALA